MPAQPNGSIARRLFRLNALTTVLIALLVIAAFAIRQGSTYIGNKERQLHFLATVLAVDLGPSLAANEVDRAEATLTSLQADPFIAAAGIYDKRGDLFASYRRPEGGSGRLQILPETAPAAQSIHTRRSIEVSVEVPGDGESQGIVYLRRDLDWSGLLTPLGLTGLGVLAGALLLAFFSSSLIGGGLSSRLAELATLARNAAARHDYDVEVPVLGQDEVGRLARALDELLRDFRRHEEEKDGSLREAKASLESLRTSAKRLESQQGILEREAAARQSQRSQAEATAREAAGARQEFVGQLRQELHEPIEAVIQAVRALRRDSKLANPPHRELLAIDRSARHLLTVIDDVIALSSGADTEAAPAQAPFDLPALLGGLAEVFRVRTAPKRIAFAFEPVGALPAVVAGDAARLRQALLGLLGNAARFTEQGRIDLVVGAVGKRIRFEIRDTGLPLAAEADRANDPRFAAGLEKAQLLIAALGGTLKMRARSESGEPAFNVFWFDLELAASSEAVVDPLA